MFRAIPHLLDSDHDTLGIWSKCDHPRCPQWEHVESYTSKKEQELAFLSEHASLTSKKSTERWNAAATLLLLLF